MSHFKPGGLIGKHDGDSVPSMLDRGRWLITRPGESLSEANARLMAGEDDVHAGEPTAAELLAAMRDDISGN